MEAFINYLEQRHPPLSVRKYRYDIEHYQSFMANHQTATYLDIMKYVGHLRRQYNNPRTIKTILQSIKKYYQYLVDTDQRTDHPCRLLRLQDAKKRAIQIQDLFTPEELDTLLTARIERYSEVVIKNQVIISLLINQALLPKEIAQLRVKDLDLNKGTIYVHSSPKLNARTIKLKAEQILLIHQYLSVDRTQLMNKGKACGYKADLDKLIVNLRGTPESGQIVHRIISSMSHLFPDRKLSPMTIRQSVIANKIKEGHNIRAVQIFAGHKDLSTTEIYRQTSVEELKIEVLKYHPLQLLRNY